VQLGLADAIVVTLSPGSELTVRYTDDAATLSNPATDLRNRFTGPVLEASVKADVGEDEWSGTKVLALAGIANPRRFYALLSDLGADVVARAEYRDHHAFTEHDAARVLAQASDLDAQIVTTEKDWVRLAGSGGSIATLRENARTIPIRVEFAPADAVRLASLLDAALINQRRTAAVRP
jgi:tetraacyldisaccharide 4'-kinase